MNTNHLNLAAGQRVEVNVEDLGSGRPYLLLHGGAGPISMSGFAQRLAGAGGAHAVLPTHPGFNGTQRPAWLNSIGGLADAYVALVEQLNLTDVTVVGNSIGGWLAAEMALRGSQRLGRFILIDAVGIVVDGQPVADIFQLTLEQLSQFSYHNPEKFRIDPSKMTDVQRQAMAGNRQALAVYGGQPAGGDPTLLGRLSAVTAPTLLLWGASDRIATPEYGRAYAAAIPSAEFRQLPATGHLPQIESPDLTLAALADFVGAPVGR